MERSRADLREPRLLPTLAVATRWHLLLIIQVVIVRVSLKAKSEAEADEHVVDVDLSKLSVEHGLIDDA